MSLKNISIEKKKKWKSYSCVKCLEKIWTEIVFMKMKKFWNIVDLCVVCPSLQTSNSLMSSAEIGTLQTWTDKILNRFRRRSWNLHCLGAKLSLKTFLLNLFFFFQVCMKLPSRIGTGRSIAHSCTHCLLHRSAEWVARLYAALVSSRFATRAHSTPYVQCSVGSWTKSAR